LTCNGSLRSLDPVLGGGGGRWQALALAALPVLTIERIGEAPSRHRLPVALGLRPRRSMGRAPGLRFPGSDASGFNHAEGAAAGLDGPKELPCQALDHATGYLMAFGAMMARLRQAREGGSWLVQASLAQTGRWIWQQGRLENGFAIPEPSPDEVAGFIETSASPFGEIRAIRHVAALSETPAVWSRPTVPLGADAPRWPARPTGVPASR
jgi:hypothetical protein